MVAVRVEPLTAATFDAAVGLEVTAEQRRFVASNTLSIAQAWARPSARPLLLRAAGEPVGFALVDSDPKTPRTAHLVRFMVDRRRQGRGHGARGLAALLAHLRSQGHSEVRLSYVPGNTAAHRLYTRHGFVETGEVDDGERVMVLEYGLG